MPLTSRQEPAARGSKPSIRTIHDIAAAMGVSAKTVSRVINDMPGVGDATRTRIRAFIEEIGYHPHAGARSMRSAPTDSIGVTVPAPIHDVPLSQDFFIWLFNELYDTFSARGYFVCFDLNPFVQAGKVDYGRGLWEQRYGACLISGPLRSDDTVLRRIHDSGAPYVAYGRLDSVPEANFATVDYEEGAYLSTRYLIDRGHRHIAMLKAFDGYQPGAERRRGYARAMTEAGLPVETNLVLPTNFAPRQTAQVVTTLLSNPSVTALLDCSATEDAESIREGARLAGRRLGEDIEVITWTYTQNATVLKEASAHVWLPVREAAGEGLRLLAKHIEDRIDEPIQILRHAQIYPTISDQEISKPSPLFASRA